MSPWQAAKQIQFLLQSTLWTDAPQGVVFAAVRVTQGIGKEEGMAAVRFPAVFLSLMDAESDPTSPGIKNQRWKANLVVAHAGDQLGEYALLGGQRTTLGGSSGRGLLELEERLLSALNLADQTNQLNVVLVASSAPEATLTEGYGYVVERDYLFSSVLTTSRTYPAPNGGNVLTTAKGTPSGGFTPVTVSWAAFTPRFDLHAAVAVPPLQARGKMRLVRKAGTSAPATVTDGTELTLGSALATSYVDSLATSSGSWSYGLFAQFDEFGDATTSLRLSTPAVATVVV